MFHALCNGHKYTIHSDHTWAPVDHKIKIEYIKYINIGLLLCPICKIDLKFPSVVSYTTHSDLTSYSVTLHPTHNEFTELTVCFICHIYPI